MNKLASRIESVFGVRPEEYAPVAWSFTYFFCILSSYYMVRSVREMLAAESGATNVPWLFSGTFVAMLIASPVFGWIASRFPRRRFLPWVYWFFAANMLLFWVALTVEFNATEKYGWIGVGFFVWISIFNLFVVSVFWSFMADIYSKAQSRRLFGLISAGGSAGALVGPAVTSQLAVAIGSHNLLPISACVLLIGVVCISRLKRWVAETHEDDIETTVASDRVIGGSFLSGATALFKTRYLIVIGIGSVIASLMGTALYMFMIEIVATNLTDGDERTRVFALMDLATNAITLVIQLLIVRHSVSKLGIGATLSLLPLVSLLGFILLAANPAFAVVVVLQVVRRAMGFGLSKPTNDMLYSVVPTEQKYKAKNFIDTAIYRGGDVVGSWAIKGLQVLSLGISGIALVMLPFAIIWAWCAFWLGAEYKRRDKNDQNESSDQGNAEKPATA